jgi:amino acid transporter
VKKKITLFSLTLLTITAVDSIRNLPSSALFGSSVIFFFCLGAILFLIPIALVAAELSSLFQDKGGVYHWINKAFGNKTAMLAIWLQWINTMVWYPTILLFIAGSIAYLVDPSLASSPSYTISTVLILFWGLTFINLFGLHLSARLNELLGIVGTIFPLLFLIGLGVTWIILGKPMEITFSLFSIFPHWASSYTWVSLISVMASFLGMELSGVHINEIDNPQRNFPKAVFLSSFFILFTMLFGSLSIAMVVPRQEINLIAGVLQLFSKMFTLFHIEWCIPILTILIVIGSIGNMINWLISPAKGLLHAAEFGFLPPFFTKQNRYGVASRILITQAIFVSAFCLVYFLIPSINAFYWFLTALSASLYMIVYILLFLAAIFLHYRYVDRPKAFKVPGGTLGIWITTSLGIFGCLLTIIVGFFPPPTIEIESISRYAFMFLIGNLSMISPVILFYLYKKRGKEK